MPGFDGSGPRGGGPRTGRGRGCCTRPSRKTDAGFSDSPRVARTGRLVNRMCSGFGSGRGGGGRGGR